MELLYRGPYNVLLHNISIAGNYSHHKIHYWCINHLVIFPKRPRISSLSKYMLYVDNVMCTIEYVWYKCFYHKCNLTFNPSLNINTNCVHKIWCVFSSLLCIGNSMPSKLLGKGLSTLYNQGVFVFPTTKKKRTTNYCNCCGEVNTK